MKQTVLFCQCSQELYTSEAPHIQTGSAEKGNEEYFYLLLK